MTNFGHLDPLTEKLWAERFYPRLSYETRLPQDWGTQQKAPVDLLKEVREAIRYSNLTQS